MRSSALHDVSGFADVSRVSLSIPVFLVLDDINDREIIKKIFVGLDVLISVSAHTVILFAKAL